MSRFVANAPSWIGCRSDAQRFGSLNRASVVSGSPGRAEDFQKNLPTVPGLRWASSQMKTLKPFLITAAVVLVVLFGIFRVAPANLRMIVVGR